MERPALMRLLDDIEAGKVDCVIVYRRKRCVVLADMEWERHFERFPQVKERNPRVPSGLQKISRNRVSASLKKISRNVFARTV